MAIPVPTHCIKAQDYPVKSVTIFMSSKAEIVRTFTSDLKAGQNKIEIEGLPSSIDTHSIRVSGLGEATLCDVVCTIEPQSERDKLCNPSGSSEVIYRLKLQKLEIEKEKLIRENEADLLLKYAKTLTGEHVSPADMSTFLVGYVEKSLSNLKAISELNESIRNVERRIDKEMEKASKKVGDAQGKISIVLQTSEATVVDLKLTYIVSDVHWSPVYELHAKTESGKPLSSVTLLYRARVRQSTGEEWCNSDITLSTVSSDLFSQKIPELKPVKLFPQSTTFQTRRLFNTTAQNQPNSLFGSAQPPQAPPQRGFFGQPGSPPPPNASLSAGPASGFPIFGSTTRENISAAGTDDELYEEIANPTTISESAAFVAETPVAIAYSIEGKSSIPSDDIEHQVTLAVLPFNAQISYVTIPRIDPRVYLQCQVKNTSDYRLLGGPLSVILDDSYVSKTSIDDVNMGDNFDCTLGNDSSTKVTYSRTSRTHKNEGGAFAEVTHTTKYTTKVTIHNKHPFVLDDIVVREVIPTCDDKRTKVILRKPEELANAKDGDEIVLNSDENDLKVMWEKLVDGKGGEKEGRFQWMGKIKAMDKLVLEYKWEVKGPFDSVWTETIPHRLFGQNWTGATYGTLTHVPLRKSFRLWFDVKFENSCWNT